METNTLNSIMVELLQDARHNLKAAGETVAGATEKSFQFASEQLPLMVQEFLRWKFWEGLGTGILEVCIAIFLTWAIFKVLVPATKGAFEEGDEAGIVVGLVGIVAAVIVSAVCIAFSVIDFKQAAKTVLAPRIYMVEWTAEQLKSPAPRR